MQEGHDQEPLRVAVALDQFQQRAEDGLDGLIEKTGGLGGRAGNHRGHDHVHDDAADGAAGGHDAEDRAERVFRHDVHDQRTDVDEPGERREHGADGERHGEVQAR